MFFLTIARAREISGHPTPKALAAFIRKFNATAPPGARILRTARRIEAESFSRALLLDAERQTARLHGEPEASK